MEFDIVGLRLTSIIETGVRQMAYYRNLFRGKRRGFIQIKEEIVTKERRI